MEDTIRRKCAQCKNIIKIERNRIEGVLQYKGKYYHSQCFKELATKKAESCRGNPQMWQDALVKISDLECDTKKTLERYIARDELNEWILNHYNIAVVPSYFWQVIADIENGSYKNQKCKPISIDMLLSMWQWGQDKLNKIALTNKANHKGPNNDNDRLRYDLAVLINHTDDFKKHQNKLQAMESERKIAAKDNLQINYNKIKTISKNEGLDDISSLLEELI